MKEQIKPGFFGKKAAADDSRRMFDIKNQQLLGCSKEIDIAFIGDSITQGWEIDAYFDSSIGFVLNRGIGSDTTEYILKRADADVFQFHPKKLVYMAGINDLIEACPDAWWREPGRDMSRVLDEIEHNIEAFMQKCGDTKAYFCSVLPTDFCSPYNSFGLEAVIRSLNARIYALCEKYGTTYVDYYSGLCTDDGMKIRNGLTFDGVHPNYYGYKIMSDILKAAIA